MKQLHEAKGTKFIIGVPLHDNNEVLVKAIIKKAKTELGDALLGIELGNEPMYWPCPGVVSGQGGKARQLVQLCQQRGFGTDQEGLRWLMM
jgi:hypothetical protein